MTTAASRKFNRIRYRRYDGAVFLYAFDLFEPNGDDLRRDPLEMRKATLSSVLSKAGPGVRLNEHWDGTTARSFSVTLQDGPRRYRVEAKDSPYRSGRSSDWLKRKNPVRREAEED